MAGGDDAPADVAVECDRCLPDLHLAADPCFLVVRRDAVDLEQHAEPAAVDRVGDAGFLAQPLERCSRHDGDGSAVGRPVDRVVVGPEQLERTADLLRDHMLPGPVNLS